MSFQLLIDHDDAQRKFAHQEAVRASFTATKENNPCHQATEVTGIGESE